MNEILLSKEFVMIILFVLLYILAKTTKERDKASMESARNIIIYKEGYAYRVEEYLEQVQQYFGKVSRLLWIMAIGEWTYTALPNWVEQGTNMENPVIITVLSGIIAGFSLLQGKTIMLTGFPCLFPVLPCLALQCN